MDITKIIKGAQIALIALIAFWGVRALMVYFTPQSAWTPLSNTPSVQPLANTAGSSVRGAIDTSFDPFHRNVVAAQVDLGQDAPETMLDLTLVGRRAGRNGMAILRLPDGKQKGFRIEDEILSGVILEAVNVEYIVISQDGRLERLTFEKSEVGLKSTLPETESQTETSKQSISGQSNNAVPISAEAALPREKKPYSSSGNRVVQRTLPQGVASSPNPLLSVLNFTPQRVNNQVTGYKVSPKQAGFNTAALGLQPGDEITRIGSIGLQRDNVDFGAVLSGLQGSGSTTVDLIRNGQAISVKVAIP